MSLVYAGICCHAPGITNRPEKANPTDISDLKHQFDVLRQEIEAAKPDAIVMISSEHFANFFNDNMPAYSIGMADLYTGPIEDARWLGIPRVSVPGSRGLSERLIASILHYADVGYAEEWRFDHGMMVPLHHLTPEYDIPIIPVNINCQAPPLSPLHRAHTFGIALRRAIESVPERIVLIGTGGTSHWPCTPDTGKINSEWDEIFLRDWCANDVSSMTAYRDDEILSAAGPGAWEIRTSIAVAGAAGGTGDVRYYKPIPEFACGCLIASMTISNDTNNPHPPTF
jgi:2,3-dihydroxyphenylpropionate 1,2-dioxygenase